MTAFTDSARVTVTGVGRWQVPGTVDDMFALGGALRRRFRLEHNIGLGFDKETGCVVVRIDDLDDLPRLQTALEITRAN